MSNDTIFNLFFAIAVGVLSLLTAIGAIKEGRESLKKLKEHEDLKKRNKIPPFLKPQQFTIERSTTFSVKERAQL